VWIEPVRDWNVISPMRDPWVPRGVNWTCEGLKQLRGWQQHKYNFSVNWTCEGLKRLWNFSAGGTTAECELNLWGIETPTFSVMSGGIVPVWIEPVRDWNELTGEAVSEQMEVWIEPVRDWNSNSSSCVSSSWRRVNWTCEGLKHFYTKTRRNPETRVNWTCEGLKPSTLFAIQSTLQMCELNLWGIETQEAADNFSPPPHVWIEPVRDWNWRE